MKTLQDTNNNSLDINDEKTEGLIRDHFFWNEEGRKLEEEEVRGDDKDMEGGALEKMIRKVEIALSGTQNSSATGLDDVSYRFIKTIKDTILREKILEEVVKDLIKRIISREWQNSKVVIIHKLGKDHEKMKGWRLINLINCIGKLEEKVVADVLQGYGLLHKHQFRSVKGRLASKVALRTVTRAQ